MVHKRCKAIVVHNSEHCSSPSTILMLLYQSAELESRLHVCFPYSCVRMCVYYKCATFHKEVVTQKVHVHDLILRLVTLFIRGETPFALRKKKELSSGVVVYFALSL